LKNQPSVLIKQAPNQPKKLRTSPNYSPKYAIILTVCSESNHHYLIAVAVFVQHTTDLSYKATSNIQNDNGSNIITTIKLSLIIPHIAVEIKCSTLVHIITSAILLQNVRGTA